MQRHPGSLCNESTCHEVYFMYPYKDWMQPFGHGMGCSEATFGRHHGMKSEGRRSETEVR